MNATTLNALKAISETALEATPEPLVIYDAVVLIGTALLNNISGTEAAEIRHLVSLAGETGALIREADDRQLAFKEFLGV